MANTIIGLTVSGGATFTTFANLPNVETGTGMERGVNHRVFLVEATIDTAGELPLIAHGMQIVPTVVEVDTVSMTLDGVQAPAIAATTRIHPQVIQAASGAVISFDTTATNVQLYATAPAQGQTETVYFAVWVGRGHSVGR